MASFIENIKNIVKIEELRKRILYTLLLLLVYRVGTHIVLPTIDPSKLELLASQGGEGIFGLLNMFTGGAFSRASIFGLGIMPYISASIVIQLLTVAVPYFQRLQREGESGRKKMNQYTRYLTVLILLVQGPSYLTNIINQLKEVNGAFIVDPKSPFFWISSMTILISGTMFTMWLGERITDRGIGNGISLLIMVGIIARLPFSLLGEFGQKIDPSGGGLVAFLFELIILFLVFVVSIMLTQGTRRIPVQYAKRMVGNKLYQGARQYYPLKVNAAGVMPIIFAQALMMLPLSFASFNLEGDNKIIYALSNYTGWLYNTIFAVLIILFTYFYTAITFNPTMMAEDLKRNGGFIPGVKPGKKTVEFLDTIMSRITLPGSIFLALIAILPVFAILAGVEQGFAQFFGGTSLLIMVGVILDTLQQIESHLLMRHYDGLMKTGRIKGKSGAAASV